MKLNCRLLCLALGLLTLTSARAEWADAVYRDGLIIPDWSGGGDYHAGLVYRYNNAEGIRYVIHSAPEKKFPGCFGEPNSVKTGTWSDFVGDDTFISQRCDGNPSYGLRDIIIDEALDQIGASYWSALLFGDWMEPNSSPGSGDGHFRCDGLVEYCYEQAGLNPYANNTALYWDGPDSQCWALDAATQTDPYNVSMSYPSSQDPNNPTISSSSEVTLRASAVDKHSGLSYDSPFLYQYATYDNNGWGSWVTLGRYGSSHNVTINWPNTLFAWRVLAYDNDGNSEPSAVYYFKYVPTTTTSTTRSTTRSTTSTTRSTTRSTTSTTRSTTRSTTSTTRSTTTTTIGTSQPSPVYRFWSDVLMSHFYTISESEKNNVLWNLSHIWRYEGPVFYAYQSQLSGSSPVYRFWSDALMSHFYTISESEKNNVLWNLSHVWRYEGPMYYAFASSTPLSFSMSATASEVTDPVLDVGTVASAGGDTARIPESESISVAKYSATDTAARIAPDTFQMDVAFSLSYTGLVVSAYVYDLDSESWSCILDEVQSPDEVVIRDIQADQPCWLEVWAGPPAGGEPELRHAGWIEQTSVEPGEVPEEEVPAGLDDGGVHSPVIRITAPAQDSSLTFTLYSYEAGLVDEIYAFPDGQTVELPLPAGNCWYWIGGWREADGELVLSRWLRHQTGE